MTFEFSTFDPEQHRVPDVPKGTKVRAIVKKAGWKNLPDSHNQVLKLVFEVHEPQQYKGAFLSKQFLLRHHNEEAVGIAKKDLAAFYDAAGMKLGSVMNEQGLEGLAATLLTTTRKGSDGNEYPDVRFVRPEAAAPSTGGQSSTNGIDDDIPF